MKPLALFIFGKSGSGKSYVGDILGDVLGWHVYHADENLTKDMKLALEERRPFTNDMRDLYFSIISEKIIDLAKIHQHLVITQGAYKKRHRDYLLSKVPELEFVYIRSNEKLILERLSKRKGGISIPSAKVINDDFEPPVSGGNIIVNDGSRYDIIEQLSSLAETMPNKFSQQDAAKLRLC